MKAGWENVKLGDLCEIERGGSPRPIDAYLTDSEEGINWIKISDATASGKYIYRTEQKIKPEGVKRSRLVYDGDFILSNSMSFGRPYIMRTSGCIHDGWLVLRQPKVNPDYLYLALGSDLIYQQFDRLASGSTVRNLNIGLAKTVEIPVPSEAEQQRIVAILDEAFAGIATARAAAEQNRQNARALFESHLQAVFSQRGEGWVLASLGDVCEFENGDRGKNYPNRSEYVDSGVPWINTGHIQPDGTLSETEMNYITKEKFDSLRSGKIRTGDLVYCLRGATLGKTALVDPLTVGAVASSLVILRPSKSLNSRFLYYFLTSPVGQGLIKAYENGAAQPNLGAKSVAKYEIAFPDLHGQEHVVATLDMLAAETQNLEALYQRKLEALDELKQSLLHRAFSGQL